MRPRACATAAVGMAGVRVAVRFRFFRQSSRFLASERASGARRSRALRGRWLIHTLASQIGAIIAVSNKDAHHLNAADCLQHPVGAQERYPGNRADGGRSARRRVSRSWPRCSVIAVQGALHASAGGASQAPIERLTAGRKSKAPGPTSVAVSTRLSLQGTIVADDTPTICSAGGQRCGCCWSLSSA